MSRHRQSHSSFQNNESSSFMDDLQESLLAKHDLYGIGVFEGVFNRKKILDKMIEKEKKLKLQAHTSYLKAQQRVKQIQQLQNKVDKQASLLQNQIQKISDVHNMSKILMMQKVLKMQIEAEQSSRRRNQCQQIRQSKHQSTLATIARKNIKIDKQRTRAMSKTFALREQVEQKKYETLQANRRKADSVRLDRQRRQSRLKKIQDFKLQRSHKNYADKVQRLQRTIDTGRMQLTQLVLKQRQQEAHLQAAERVTSDYIDNFFATEQYQ